MVRLADVFIRKAAPPRFDWFGIRYVNRVTNEATIADLPKLVRPEMLGTAGLALPDDVTVNHSLLEEQFNRGAHSMLIRCGILPASATIDLAVPATNLPSWISGYRLRCQWG
jgi:hypothetical protein